MSIPWIKVLKVGVVSPITLGAAQASRGALSTSDVTLATSIERNVNEFISILVAESSSGGRPDDASHGSGYRDALIARRSTRRITRLTIQHGALHPREPRGPTPLGLDRGASPLIDTVTVLPGTRGVTTRFLRHQQTHDFHLSHYRKSAAQSIVGSDAVAKIVPLNDLFPTGTHYDS